MTGAAMMRLLPGLGVALIAVFVATLVSAGVPALPVLTVAVVLGIIVGQAPGLRMLLDGTLEPGILFAATTLMRAGIVLLGLRLSLVDIANLGLGSILGIVVLVVVAFLATWWFGRMMRLPGREPLLVAAGFAICGASAIGAMASATRSAAREQATPIALVTLCGTLAIAVLPALRHPLGLSDEEFGRWVGAGVHDVGQVVATAQTAGATALAIAVVVKLTRVLLLAPMVTAAAVIVRRSDDGSGAASVLSENEGVSSRPPVVPLFVIGFIAAVLLNSFVFVPERMLAIADQVQTVVLAAALFALGTSVRVVPLLRTGWRALIVGLVSWALVAGLALALVRI